MIITSSTLIITPIPPAVLVIAPMLSAISLGVSGVLGETPPTSVAMDCNLLIPVENRELLEVEDNGVEGEAAFEALALTAPNVRVRTRSPVKRTLVLDIISPLKWWLHFGESTQELVS